MQIRADTNAPELNFLGKLQLNSKTWESGYYNITQNCPEQPRLDNEVLLLASLLTILVILAGITLYVKVLK